MSLLSGKVAAVTGAGSGIGAASAKILAREGAAVVVSDINTAGAEATVAAITEAGGRAVATTVDVAVEEHIKAMVQLAVDTFGGLDILHNNAALVNPAFLGRDTTVVDIEAADWDRVMAINVRGPMLGCKYAIPEMEKRGGGSIIITSSVGAHNATVNQTAYGVSKGALDTLIKYVATGFGKRGIRCNGIAPGVVLSESALIALPPAVRDMHLMAQPTSRLGVPEDIGEMAAFLASDKAGYINGVTIPIHGGMTIINPHQVELWAHEGELVPFADAE
ncbi:short-chain dehydrogenase [Nocardia nova]|uniref:SDR family NAD(P)-dependent oxidoreductase n=1 Tax=Nocardia nova TaxID=37330 RepID=UPI000CEA0B11|nr:short-chain dehydrogenase [Nocardia nova]